MWPRVYFLWHGDSSGLKGWSKDTCNTQGHWVGCHCHANKHFKPVYFPRMLVEGRQCSLWKAIYQIILKKCIYIYPLTLLMNLSQRHWASDMERCMCKLLTTALLREHGLGTAPASLIENWLKKPFRSHPGGPWSWKSARGTQILLWNGLQEKLLQKNVRYEQVCLIYFHSPRKRGSGNIQMYLLILNSHICTHLGVLTNRVR